MQDQCAELSWQDGDVPVSARFGDPYFSLDDGLGESRHVFLAGNDLPARLRPGFRIAELGFGAGLNFLAAARCWIDAGCSGVLDFTSFEAFPLSTAQIARALSAFPDLEPLSTELLAGWNRHAEPIRIGDAARLTLVVGDARHTLPEWSGAADAWFLDGFSPAKNPELWQPDLMAQVALHTAPGGTAATYTAAGFVRRGLQQAGFGVTRTAGFGRKRHMTRAVLA